LGAREGLIDADRARDEGEASFALQRGLLVDAF